MDSTPRRFFTRLTGLIARPNSLHLQGITPYRGGVNQLWGALQEDHNLERAFAWLCEQTGEAAPNHSVWDYRRQWAQRKAALRQALWHGTFAFGPARQVEVDEETGRLEHREVRDPEDRLVIRAIAQVLEPVMGALLAPECTHLKGHGGLHRAVRETQDWIAAHPDSLVIKSDIQGYYAHIDHLILAEQLRALIPQEHQLHRLMWQFLRRTTEQGGVYRESELGIPLGASLSPLLGALYLAPLDAFGTSRTGAFYRRYMDDWVLVLPKRHALRTALKAQYALLQGLCVTTYPNKTFIGKVAKGFDFLGFHCRPTGVRVSDAALPRRDAKVVRLYERGASKERIARYLARWLGWVLGITGTYDVALGGAGNCTHAIVDNNFNLAHSYCECDSDSDSVSYFVGLKSTNARAGDIRNSLCSGLYDRTCGLPAPSTLSAIRYYFRNTSGAGYYDCLWHTDGTGFSDPQFALSRNAAPVASSVQISGTASAGLTLTGTYSYSDTDNDLESGSTYRWVQSADNDVGTAGDNADVVTATDTGNDPGNNDYTVQPGDLGAYLFYCVTPGASVGTTPGTEVCSSASGPVCDAAPAVTNTDGSGDGSLRQAVADACAGAIIDATGVSGTIALASDLTLSDLTLETGTLTINGSGLVLGGSPVTLKPSSSAILTIDSAISGSGGLVKSGAGTLILSGTNTYTGETTANAGTLQVDGALAAGTVTVQDGSTLSGTGTTGAVTVDSTSFLAPGPGTGTLTVNGNLTIASGSTLSAEIAGSGVTEYGQLLVNGAVDVTNATLSVNLSYTTVVGTLFTLINNAGSNPITGTFNGLAEGAIRTANGSNLKASYVGGTGHDFTLTVFNAAPVASSVQISGTPSLGQSLTGTYSYGDAESDTESGSTYRWVRSTDNDVSTAADNAEAVSATATDGAPGNNAYTVQSADLGKYLFYCVTSGASSGTSPGTEACSSASGPVCDGTPDVTITDDSGVGSLRQAIADACAGSTISFNGGIQDGTITLASTLILDKNLTIDGANSNVTITNDSNNLRLFSVSGATVTLKGLTLADASSTNSSGTALYLLNTSTVTLDRCLLRDNSVTGYDGGALYNNGSTLTIQDSYFTGNQADSAGKDGGAIYTNGGTTTVLRSSFVDNSSDGGSAIRQNGGTMTIANSTFSSNSSTTNSHDGGAIRSNGTLTISNSTFANNTNDNGYNGGLALQSSGTATLKNVLLSGNSPANCFLGSTPTGSNNLATDASCTSGGFTQITNALLGSVGDYGSAVTLPGTAAATPRPSPCSPAAPPSTPGMLRPVPIRRSMPKTNGASPGRWGAPATSGPSSPKASPSPRPAATAKARPSAPPSPPPWP